jgi:hypothetical protein
MTGGTKSASSGDAVFNIFSGGNFSQGTRTLYHATDDEQGSERLIPSSSTLRPTEECQYIEDMNDLNLDPNMDSYGPDDHIVPPSPRRSGKVRGHSSDITSH